MNLTTEVKNQVIIFHDGSREFVDDIQAKNIFESSTTGNKLFRVKGTDKVFSYSAIAKIIPIEDFYNQYPDQVPDHRPEIVTEMSQPYESIEQQYESNKNQFKEILRGLKEEIDIGISKGEKPLHAIEIYKKKLEKYKQKFKDFHDQQINELAEEFNGVVI